MTIEDMRAILASVSPTVDWASVAPDHDLEDAGLDSLDRANVVMEVESKASVTIDDERYDTLRSMEDFVAFANS